jgi:hypothetical protein
MACLHTGLNGEYGQVAWDENYVVPSDPVDGDICDYPLARNLATLVVSIAAEEIVDFVTAATPRQKSWHVTLRDLKIQAAT